jgi:hypothetical protein
MRATQLDHPHVLRLAVGEFAFDAIQRDKPMHASLTLGCRRLLLGRCDEAEPVPSTSPALVAVGGTVRRIDVHREGRAATVVTAWDRAPTALEVGVFVQGQQAGDWVRAHLQPGDPVTSVGSLWLGSPREGRPSACLVPRRVSVIDLSPDSPTFGQLIPWSFGVQLPHDPDTVPFPSVIVDAEVVAQ